MVHHRAQLGVLLRLNGLAIPAVYNDSADEQGGMFMEPRAATSRHRWLGLKDQHRRN